MQHQIHLIALVIGYLFMTIGGFALLLIALAEILGRAKTSKKFMDCFVETVQRRMRETNR